jgi:hypothetical protein
MAPCSSARPIQVGPDPLVGIQVWCIAGELLQLDTLGGHFGEEVFRPRAPDGWVSPSEVTGNLPYTWHSRCFRKLTGFTPASVATDLYRR